MITMATIATPLARSYPCILFAPRSEILSIIPVFPHLLSHLPLVSFVPGHRPDLFMIHKARQWWQKVNSGLLHDMGLKLTFLFYVGFFGAGANVKSKWNMGWRMLMFWDGIKKESAVLFFSEIKGPVAARQRIKALHFPLEFRNNFV